jgi:FkbM family methyltransferase
MAGSEPFILKFHGKVFCTLFNIKSMLSRKNIRFDYDNNNKLFCATGDGKKLKFYHRRQAKMAYEHGIKARAYKLAREYFLDTIEFFEGDLIIDCGANVGDVKLFFDFEKKDVRYIGIEPSPKEFECLADNVGKSNAMNYGLWKEDSTLDFYVASERADSSLIEPPHFDEVICVETKRLDNLFKNIGPIKLLKLEAEGAEPEIIQGASGILRNIRYISADLGAERGLRQEFTVEDVTNFLLSNGFRLIAMSHVRVCALYENLYFRKKD